MKTNRVAKRITNQAYEQRRRLAGAVTRSFRLSPKAANSLQTLAATFGCTGSDVINGFLLGTIDREVITLMREHRLSEAEAREWIRVREEDTRWTVRARA